jgi:hypothetical protein
MTGDTMVDITNDIPEEADKLLQEFKRIERQHAAALVAVRKKLPIRLTGYYTTREWMQIINIIADALDETK